MFKKSNLETMKHIRLRRPQPHLLSTSVVNLVIKTLFGTSQRPLRTAALVARVLPVVPTVAPAHWTSVF